MIFHPVQGVEAEHQDKQTNSTVNRVMHVLLINCHTGIRSKKCVNVENRRIRRLLPFDVLKSSDNLFFYMLFTSRKVGTQA